jgi:hypothetical protein
VLRFGPGYWGATCSTAGAKFTRRVSTIRFWRPPFLRQFRSPSAQIRGWRTNSGRELPYQSTHEARQPSPRSPCRRLRTFSVPSSLSDRAVIAQKEQGCRPAYAVGVTRDSSPPTIGRPSRPSNSPSASIEETMAARFPLRSVLDVCTGRPSPAGRSETYTAQMQILCRRCRRRAHCCRVPRRGRPSVATVIRRPYPAHPARSSPRTPVIGVVVCGECQPVPRAVQQIRTDVATLHRT